MENLSFSSANLDELLTLVENVET